MRSGMEFFKNKLEHISPPITITPNYDDDLSPDLYIPFLQKLFNILEKDSHHSFLLTGSAAKQLQDQQLKNPNDIDLIMDIKDDLDEGARAPYCRFRKSSGSNITA